MTTNARASFDGWELSFGADVGPSERVWSSAPGAGEGLLVEGLDDAHVGAVPPVRSLFVHRGALTKKGLAALLGRQRDVEALALVECGAVTGGIDALAATTMRELWITASDACALRALKPIAEAKTLVGLFLDGAAPTSLFRWIAALPALTRLDVSRPPDDAEVGRTLAPLAALARLEQVALRRALVSDTVLKGLGALPALVRLDLSGSALSASPSSWRALRGLKELRLRDARRVDAILATLEGFSSLSLLDLRGVNLAPRHFDRLRGALPHARLLTDAPRVDSAPPAPGSSSSGTRAEPSAPPRVARVPTPPLPADPLRWPDDAPPIASLHVMFPDERGAPNGFDRRFDLDQWAHRIHPRHLIDHLDAGERVDATTSGLLLLPLCVRRYDPNADLLTADAITAARALLDDEQGVDWQWGGPSQVFRFRVGALASAAVLVLLAWRAQQHRTTLAADADVLHDVLRAELRREQGAPWSVTSHLIDRSRDPGFAAAVARWLGWLVDVMNDAVEAPRARIAAMERLAHDGERMPASVKDIVGASWKDALGALARHATDPNTEMRFRRVARQLVAERAPELLDEMRAAGQVPSRALPRYERLSDALGAPSRERVLPTAPDIDGATCRAALDGDDVSAWFSALAFAPYCGDAAEARDCAARAARLVGRKDRLKLDGAPTSESAALGDVAAHAIATLVRDRGVPRAPLLDVALEALTRCEVEPTLVTPPGALVALGALAATADGAEPPAIVSGHFLDRTRPAGERFLLLLACFALRRAHAQRVLADVDEDGDLRALIGCLSGLEQPEGVASLPLCEPSSAVSIDNLRASLALGRHPVSVRRATQALVSRVLPWDARGEALARAAEDLRAIPLPPTLREVVDAGPGLGRIAGARWLAIRGEREDEARLARVMVEDGGWTARRPQGATARTPIEQLMAALVSETVVEDCESDFEPLLEIGFGAEQARRVIAKAYVLIAQRHLDAGREAFARRSAAYAASLDALNLDVVRLLRSLR